MSGVLCFVFCGSCVVFHVIDLFVLYSVLAFCDVCFMLRVLWVAVCVSCFLCLSYVLRVAFHVLRFVVCVLCSVFCVLAVIASGVL